MHLLNLDRYDIATGGTPDDRRPEDPTREEIRRMCADIQSTWSPAEFKKRSEVQDVRGLLPSGRHGRA